MATFIFEGSVRPDQIPLTLDYKPAIIRREAQHSPDAEFKVTVFSGKFQTRVSVPEVTDEIISALYAPAWTVTEALVHSEGFLAGVPYTATIERVHLPDGSVKQFVLADRSLAEAHGLEKRHLEEVADLACTDLRIKLLLSDALHSLGISDYSPIACGRVADGIARFIAPDVKAPEMWRQTRELLRVDEGFLRSLSDVSKAARHADRQEVTAAINQRTAHRAWALLGRFIRFRIDGKLDPDAFPILTSSYPHGET